jgi:fatty acyl-CoA reductase
LNRNVDAYCRYVRLASHLGRFSTREWKFHDSNVRSSLRSLSPEDRQLFYFDLTQLHWQQYLADYMRGVLRFLLKEDTSTLPAARKRYKM